MAVDRKAVIRFATNLKGEIKTAMNIPDELERRVKIANLASASVGRLVRTARLCSRSPYSVVVYLTYRRFQQELKRYMKEENLEEVNRIIDEIIRECYVEPFP